MVIMSSMESLKSFCYNREGLCGKYAIWDPQNGFKFVPGFCYILFLSFFMSLTLLSTLVLCVFKILDLRYIRLRIDHFSGTYPLIYSYLWSFLYTNLLHASIFVWALSPAYNNCNLSIGDSLQIEKYLLTWPVVGRTDVVEKMKSLKIASLKMKKQKRLAD